MSDCPLAPRKEIPLTLRESVASLQLLYRAVSEMVSDARAGHRKPEENLLHIAETGEKALAQVEAPKEVAQ